MHPFRFGVIVAQASSAEAWVASARRAENLGYDILLMPDHLGGQLSPLAGLMAAAAGTTQLRVATYVLANDVRHPMAMAREAATIAKVGLVSGKGLAGLPLASWGWPPSW